MLKEVLFLFRANNNNLKLFSSSSVFVYQTGAFEPRAQTSIAAIYVDKASNIRKKLSKSSRILLEIATNIKNNK